MGFGLVVVMRVGKSEVDDVVLPEVWLDSFGLMVMGMGLGMCVGDFCCTNGICIARSELSHLCQAIDLRA